MTGESGMEKKELEVTDQPPANHRTVFASPHPDTPCRALWPGAASGQTRSFLPPSDPRAGVFALPTDGGTAHSRCFPCIERRKVGSCYHWWRKARGIPQSKKKFSIEESTYDSAAFRKSCASWLARPRSTLNSRSKKSVPCRKRRTRKSSAEVATDPSLLVAADGR